MKKTSGWWDVWQCMVNGRTSYRATEHDLSNPDAPKPDWATSHVDLVCTPTKRHAISFAVRTMKDMHGR